MSTFINGLLLSLSLIVAIGAQNAFIIRQGINNNYVFIVSAICFICDVILMCVGVFGVGEVLASNKILNLIIAIAGIIFVIYYGVLSLKSAIKSSSNIAADKGGKDSLKKVVLLTLSVTLLNPHVYLDTVFVIGASALRFDINGKILFASGAITASLIWFFGLGYFASAMRPILVKISRIIDLFVALVMFTLAISLIKYIFNIYA